MTGPARAGALLYASDIETLAAFYVALLDMEVRSASVERIVLNSPDFQLLVHALPAEIAPAVHVTTPPALRQMPLRLFFTVDNLAAARQVAAKLGGEVFTETWQGPGFIVCNARDPEGNVFQLREFGA